MYIIFLNLQNSQTNTIILPILQKRKWSLREIKYFAQCNTMNNTQSCYLNQICKTFVGPLQIWDTYFLEGKLITSLKENDQGCEGTPNHAMCKKVWDIKSIQHKEKRTQVDIGSIKSGIMCFLITHISPISTTMPNNMGGFQ